MITNLEISESSEWSDSDPDEGAPSYIPNSLFIVVWITSVNDMLALSTTVEPVISTNLESFCKYSHFTYKLEAYDYHIL